MMKFEQAREMLPVGYRLAKGVPDARFNSTYKYTIYYTSHRGYAKVCKTLKEVEEFCNNCM